MEYFIGSILTMIVFVIVTKMNRKQVAIFNKTKFDFKYSQSRIYSMIGPILPIIKMFEPKPELVTQSTTFHKKTMVRILVMNNFAYWIKDNSVWKANMDGQQIIKESAQKVDTMGMSKIELDQMIFIIDKLTKGESDDNSNSGK